MFSSRGVQITTFNDVRNGLTLIVIPDSSKSQVGRFQVGRFQVARLQVAQGSGERAGSTAKLRRKGRPASAWNLPTWNLPTWNL